jgi:MFS family permease
MSMPGAAARSAMGAHRPGVVVAVGVLVLAALAFAWLTLRDFNRLLGPELEQRAALIGGTIEGDIERALAYGIPFDRLAGTEAYLARVLEDFPEVAYAVVSDASGREMHVAGEIPDAARATAALPAVAQGGALAPPTRHANVLNHTFTVDRGHTVVGTIHIGIDRQFVQRQLDDILYDLAVILVVAVFVTFELLLVLMLAYAVAPLQRLQWLLAAQAAGDFGRMAVVRTGDAVGALTRELSQRSIELNRRFAALRTRGDAVALDALAARHGLRSDGRPALLRVPAALHDIRIPLFVFAFAEELQKSFLPLYVRELHTPVPWLDDAVVIGLPIAAWLVALVLFLPVAGGLADRIGTRRLFVLGLVPAAAGLLGAGLAGSALELTLWRAVSAVGYATVIVAAQAYAFRLVGEGGEGRAMAVFVAVVMSATMCGTAIGGIVADRVGYRAVFYLAALLTVVAGVLAHAMLAADEAGATGVTRARGRLGAALRLLRNRQLLVLLLGIAIPSAVLTAAFLWYLVPLHLTALGAGPAEIARVLMLYYVVLVLAAPLAAEAIERRSGCTWQVVGVGGLVSGLAVVGAALQGSFWAVAAAVLVTGAAHTLVRAPHVGLALELCRDEAALLGRTTVLDLLRTLERIGMVAGLLLAAILLGRFDAIVAILVTGLMTAGGALLFLLLGLLDGARQRRPA